MSIFMWQDRRPWERHATARPGPQQDSRSPGHSDLRATSDGAIVGTPEGPMRDLVDVDRGMVSREIFVNEDIYRQELERVFARAWLFLGHESQIPGPGDFVVSSMGEESVIVCRDRTARIRVFLNSCRHRGMKVCRYDEGNTAEFTCPYHGWSYGTDGALVGVPFAKDAYGEQLDRRRWGLIEVAQVENYKGGIWA